MLDVLCLIALGLGYVVFTSALKEKKNVKFLGQAIGSVIMLAAIMTILLTSMTCAYQQGCPFSGKNAHCPIMKCPMGMK